MTKSRILIRLCTFAIAVFYLSACGVMVDPKVVGAITPPEDGTEIVSNPPEEALPEDIAPPLPTQEGSSNYSLQVYRGM